MCGGGGGGGVARGIEGSNVRVIVLPLQFCYVPSVLFSGLVHEHGDRTGLNKETRLS